MDDDCCDVKIYFNLRQFSVSAELEKMASPFTRNSGAKLMRIEPSGLIKSQRMHANSIIIIIIH